MRYPNLPQTIGIVLSAKQATLHELQTVYSLQDLYDMLEMLTVDAYNEDLAYKIATRT